MLKLSERDVTRQVIDYLRAEGWLTLRLESELVVGRSGKVKLLGERGMPDWLALKPVSNGLVRALFIEMKSSCGRLRTSQRLWHAWAEKRGFIVRVVRSVDELKGSL